MNLRVVTPLDIAVDVKDVSSIRAADDSGSFGIMPGHADFLTALSLTIISWRRESGTNRWHYCAVRGGVLSVEGGEEVTITTREAVRDHSIDTLAQTVLTRFRAEVETERAERTESTRLQLAAIRQIMLHLRSAGQGERAL